MAQLTDNHALLIYRVGPVLCCAPTQPVETLIQPPPLTRPPGSSDSHPGIFRHDGKLVRLTDLRQLFGVEQQDRTQPGRIIVCQLDGQYTGFLVDEIIDVIATPASGWGQISPSLSGGVFTRSLLLNDKIHLYAEFGKLQTVRNLGFLNPWIQQLKEEMLAEEKTPAQEMNIHAAMNSHTTATSPPAPAPVTMESGSVVTKPDTKSPRPPTIPCSQPSIQQDKKNAPPPTPATNHPVDMGNAAPAKKFVMQKTPHEADIKAKNSPANKRIQTATAIPPSPRPDTPHLVAQASQETTQYEGKTVSSMDKSKAGTGWLLTVILLISSGLIAAFIYLWPAQNTNPIAIATPRIPAMSYQQEKLATSESHVASESTPFAIIDKTPADKAPDAEPEKTRSPFIHKDSDRENSYRASIEHQSNEHGTNEVTIILIAPASDEVIRSNPDTQVAHEQRPDTRPEPVPNTATSEHSANKDGEQNQQQRDETTTIQEITEVLHTVVPGDTLWHIARRYIHNPFRYPELARLNKIRNPDLIYPGDRVRIIRIRQRQSAPIVTNLVTD